MKFFVMLLRPTLCQKQAAMELQLLLDFWQWCLKHAELFWKRSGRALSLRTCLCTMPNQNPWVTSLGNVGRLSEFVNFKNSWLILVKTVHKPVLTVEKQELLDKLKDKNRTKMMCEMPLVYHPCIVACFVRHLQIKSARSRTTRSRNTSVSSPGPKR